MSVRSILLSVAVLIAVSVTDPAAAAAGARQFLPNRRNRITIEDLDRAIVAEFHIEQWGATRARRTQRFA